MYRIAVIIFAFITLLWAGTRLVPQIDDIPAGWICIAKDPRGYTIKEPTAETEQMLSVTAVPSGYITVDIIENWSPPYDKIVIKKVKERKHTTLDLPTLPKGYIVTDIIFNWRGNKHRYTIEKAEKKKHRMLSISPIPEGYVEISRIPRWRAEYDLITIAKKK